MITIVLARLVLPEDFGLVVMAMVITQLASLIGDLGFGPALVQKKTITPKHVSTAMVITLVTGMLLWGVVALGSSVIASVYEEPRLGPVVAVLGAMFLLRGISGVPRDLLRRNMRFDLVAIASIISVTVGGAAGIALAIGGAGVWALVAMTLVENAVSMLVIPVLAARKLGWRPSFEFDPDAFATMWRFSASVSGTRLAHYGVSNIDNFVVGKVLGASALGIYNLAYRLMLFPILKVAEVVANVSTPAFAKLQDELRRLSDAYRKAVSRVCLVCFPVSVGTAVTAPALVPAVFGDNWLAAVPVVQVLALNGVRLAVARMSGVVYEATGRPHWDLFMMTATFFSYLIGFVIGVNWDVIGVAWAFTIVGYLILPVDMWLVHKVLEARVWLTVRAVIPVVVCTALMAAAAQSVMTYMPSSSADWLTALVAVGASAAVYLLASLLLNKDLKATFRDLAPRNRPS